jgi:mannose-1-phosphate guanylyltransferase
MKGLLLAAGEGTRLRPITNRIPKCLVPICGRPLLGIWLEHCFRSGVDEVLINLHAHAKCVRQFVAERDYGVQVHVSYEPTLLGSAGTLFANQRWIESERCFWVFYADVLTNVDLARMFEFHVRSGLMATLGVYEVEKPSRCGIVQVDETGVIREFVEKPTDPAGNLAFSGVMIGNAEFLKQLPSEIPADLGNHVFPFLRGQMSAFPIRDYLLDIGTMANYELAQRTWPGRVPTQSRTRKC